MRGIHKLLSVLAVVCCLAVAFAQYSAPAATDRDRKELAAAQAAYRAAKAKHEKNPKDVKLRQSFVAATVKLGTQTMVSPVLDRTLKYKQALRLYREALKLDPKNVEARKNSELIIGIYRSMGRPVPKT